MYAHRVGVIVERTRMEETFPREDVYWGKLRKKVRVFHYGADARQAGGRRARSGCVRRERGVIDAEWGWLCGARCCW